MGNFLVLMTSTLHSWMSPSTMEVAMDVSIAFMCGAGLFFLLLPFLKEYPVSPLPESERDKTKDVKRLQSKTRKKTDTIKGARDGRKYVEETQTLSQPMSSPNKQLLQESTPQPSWNPLQRMDQLPLLQLLSYLKVLEGLIQKEFSQIFWGISSMFSESVVATAHVLRTPSMAEHNTMRFHDACDPDQALSQAQGLPQISTSPPLPLDLVPPGLMGVTGVQEMVPSSTPKQIRHCFKRRSSRIACPTTDRGTQTSLPTKNQPWPRGLYWKDTKGYDIQKHQADTGSLSRGTLQNENIRSATILPEHYQMAHDNEPWNDVNTTNVGEQQGTPRRFLQSRKLTQLQEHLPANTDHYCKSRPQLSEPAQHSILNSESCECSKMIGSVLTGLPLKDIATCDRHKSIKKSIKKGLVLKDQDLPCSSSHHPGKGLKPRNTALRTDKLFYTKEHHSFLDSNTERKPASNITQLPVKQRRSYLQILEARDPAPPGVPPSNLPQVVYPSSPICDSKAAMILENLHHQVPGGKRVESISDGRLQSALSMHSLAEVQETQRAPPPAASHGASKAHPDPWQRHLSVSQPAFCFQVKPPQSRTIQATGTSSLQPDSSPKMAKLGPQKRLTDVDSGQPCWHVMIDPEERIPPPAAKQSDIVEGKEEPPPAWTVSLGSSEIPNEQAITIGPRDSGSLEADKNPGHLQTPTPLHSQDSGVNPQAYSMIDMISNEQPQPWLLKHDPDGPRTVHSETSAPVYPSAKVNLPSQHSLPSFQNTCQNPKTSEGLSDISMKSYEGVEPKEISMTKANIELKDFKGFQPHKERQSTIRSEAISQGERLGRVRPSISSSTHLKDTAKTWIPEKGEATSQSSCNALQYENFSTKYHRQGDSLQNHCPPSAAEQIQNVVTRNKVIYNMVAEIHSLVNILVQILENTEEYPSKVQECKVESLTSQMSASSHTAEGLYDTNQSRATSRLSCSHVSPEMHNYSFTYRGAGDELQSGIENQRAYDTHLNQGKRGMGFD
ncbi:spermatogenesis-associated protein 31A1-like isoform X2 [Mastomys coucha]|uniref:spermatogenesis-associated protein 31A1-like isoform X2 n=1 Tax=Mastomys coucha TaxID=35658 RepID=UPI0012627F72|nr:spermatogenesis-associated protein 31A1-like isoform X2 [Mastomys coucha]